MLPFFKTSGFLFIFFIQKTVWKLQICFGNQNIFFWKYHYFSSSLKVVSCLLHIADVFFPRQVFAPFWKSPLMFNPSHLHPSPAIADMQWDVFSNCCVLGCYEWTSHAVSASILSYHLLMHGIQYGEDSVTLQLNIQSKKENSTCNAGENLH